MQCVFHKTVFNKILIFRHPIGRRKRNCNIPEDLPSRIDLAGAYRRFKIENVSRKRCHIGRYADRDRDARITSGNILIKIKTQIFYFDIAASDILRIAGSYGLFQKTAFRIERILDAVSIGMGKRYIRTRFLRQ